LSEAKPNLRIKAFLILAKVLSKKLGFWATTTHENKFGGQ